mmetsp:Transcript_67070/g.123582  ORF Transcript_67070/g.123582 Transcript_67070/m.123582 type:complete len:163 (-) Transcript_67070:3-491(-)
MSRLGPLPPIGQTSLPETVSVEAWEKSFKDALKGNPISFPDASTSELASLARSLASSAPAQDGHACTQQAQETMDDLKETEETRERCEVESSGADTNSSAAAGNASGDTGAGADGNAGTLGEVLSNPALPERPRPLGVPAGRRLAPLAPVARSEHGALPGAH